MKSRRFALTFAFLASQSLWADLTVRYTFEMNPGPAFPPAVAAQFKEQVGSALPGGFFMRIKDGKCATAANAITSILDTRKGEITVVNPSTKQFATVPSASYMDGVLAQMQQLPPEAQLAVQSLFQNMKADVQTRKTGRTSTIEGIHAEENLVILTLDVPGPAIPLALRVEMHQWVPLPGEADRIPALKEIAGCSSGPGVNSPEAVIQKIFGQFAGGNSQFGDALKGLAKANGMLPLKTQVQMFAPALMALMPAQGAGAPPADANAPLMQMDMGLSEFSMEPIPDSVFQIPEGYAAAPFADVFNASLLASRAMPLAQIQPSNTRRTGTPPVPVPYDRPANGVSNPRVIHQSEPKYTEEARKARIQGSVLVSIVVGVDGIPQNLKVERSLDAGLDQKALEAVSQWRFNPGLKDGTAVPVVARIEVTFRLLDNPPPDVH